MDGFALCPGWNDKIVALEKTWFHFRLIKTGFLFLLQTIYELASCVHIPWAIGAFYHVWKWHNVQRSRSKMPCRTNMLSTDPSFDSQNHRWIATNNRDVPRVMKTKFPAMVIVFGLVSSEGHIMPPHIFELSLKVNTKVYLNVLKSVVIPWCNQVAVADPGCGSKTPRRPTSPKRPRLGFRRVLRLCTLLSLAPLLLQPEPAGLLRREHHQHDLPQHQSQPDRRHPPSIRRAPAGACGKGMLPVPDSYRDGDWGWRRLHWIDVSSTT